MSFVAVLCLLCGMVFISLEQLAFFLWRRRVACGRLWEIAIKGEHNWRSNLQPHPNAPIPEAEPSRSHHGGASRRTRKPCCKQEEQVGRKLNEMTKWLGNLCGMSLPSGRAILRCGMLSAFFDRDCLAPLHRIGLDCGGPWQQEAMVVFLTLPTCALALNKVIAIEKGTGEEQQQQLGSSAAQRCVPWVVLTLWPVYVAASHKVIHVVRQQSEDKVGSVELAKTDQHITATQEETEGHLVQQQQAQEHQQLRQMRQLRPGHREAKRPLTVSTLGKVNGNGSEGLKLAGLMAKGACPQPATYHQVSNDEQDAEFPDDFELWPKDHFWCRECRVWRPPYTYHCSKCGACIEGRDHHCGVVGVCVGDDNRAPFVVLCVLAIIACAADVVMLWPWVLAELNNVKLHLAELLGFRVNGSAGLLAAGNATGAGVR